MPPQFCGRLGRTNKAFDQKAFGRKRASKVDLVVNPQLGEFGGDTHLRRTSKCDRERGAGFVGIDSENDRLGWIFGK